MDVDTTSFWHHLHTGICIEQGSNLSSNFGEEDTENCSGWSGGAMVLGKLPVPGRPTFWIIVGQGPIALAVGAGGGCLDIFSLLYPFSSFSLSLGDDPV